MKLKDKVVLVTGGAQGIGKEICLTCAREGAKILSLIHIQEYNVEFEKVKEIIVDSLSCDEDAVTLEANLKEDLDARCV